MKIKKEEENEKKVCFCPYCKAFSLDLSVFKPRVNMYKRGYPFQCYACKKYFNHQTYVEQKYNKKRYHCVWDKGNIENAMKGFIVPLFRKGYTQRDIEKMTHLPRTLIQQITNKEKSKKEISVEAFLKDNLKIEEDTTLEEKINKALHYGCSKRMVLKLFHTSYKMLGKVYKNNEIIEEKRRIKLVDEKVILYYY